jgi:hypothetical protein
MKAKFEKKIVMMALVFAALFTLVLTGTGEAGVVCVNKTGEGGCYTKIQSGIDAAVSGDIVKVAPGLYEESITINKAIILEGSGPDKTTINSISWTAITITNISGVPAEVRGFTIKGATYGVYDGNINNVRAIIRNNYIITCGSTGIVCHNGIVSVINNVIAFNNVDGVYKGSGCDVLTLFNNIIAFNKGWGVSGATSTSYNNVVGNISGQWNGIAVGTGDISQDPLFIDPNAGNYQLQSASPSINAGRRSADDNDPDGTRNDQGAFGGPLAAAFWPYPVGGPVITDLTVTPSSVPQGGTVTIRATGEIR